MLAWRCPVALPVGFCISALVACTPYASRGGCKEDDDCRGRGEFCNTAIHSCEQSEADYTTTLDDSAPASFTDKPIPFFRGEICTAPDLAVKSASAIPLTYKPCLHSCITPKANYHQHQWACYSGLCDAMTLWYTIADGNGCPAEAWGQFPKEECVYLVEVGVDMNGNPDPSGLSTAFGPLQLDGGPVEGNVPLEIPFLSNSDLIKIHEFTTSFSVAQMEETAPQCVPECDEPSSYETCLKSCYVKGLAFKYLLQDDRVLEYELRGTFPAPVPSCDNGNPACECFQIGFG